MFREKNKTCSKCGSKISREHNFCPYCGYNIKREEDERNYGFLGKEDELFPDMTRMPFGFNRIFSGLLKQLDKQFKELDKEMGQNIKTTEKTKKPGIISKGISINISTGTGEEPEIQIRGFGPGFENLKIREEEHAEKLKIKHPKISEQKAKILSKLPKHEAIAKVRRLSNKIIYEIDLPDVKKLDDVIINQLENSIEIKAFSKDKAYFKLLPINLPIMNYKLEEGKLILELKAKD